MFGPKKTSVSSPNQNNPSQLDPQSVPMRTMQDDLEGKPVFEQPLSRENVRLNASASANPSPFGDNSGAKKASTPISVPISAPAPAPVPAKENKTPGSSLGDISYQPSSLSEGKEREMENFFNSEKNIYLKKEEQATAVPVNAVSVKGQSGKGWLIGLIFVICALVFLAGGYYFWMTRYANQPAKVADNPPTVTTEPEPIPEPSPEPLPVQPKFSSENPNYLSLDVENSSPQSIKELLLAKGAEVKGEKLAVPIEFLVTDKNNNPLSFAIFSVLGGLKLSPATMANLENDFSLFVYLDGELIRMGISVKAKDEVKLAAALIKEEKDLVKEVSPLFLGATFFPQPNTFKAGTYEGKTIRYCNLNEEFTLSVDYTVSGEQLLMGTSKNTIRAIMDKMKRASLEGENTVSTEKKTGGE